MAAKQPVRPACVPVPPPWLSAHRRRHGISRDEVEKFIAHGIQAALEKTLEQEKKADWKKQPRLPVDVVLGVEKNSSGQSYNKYVAGLKRRLDRAYKLELTTSKAVEAEFQRYLPEKHAACTVNHV
ncbi:hypothetical protein CAPTEDRAFT_192824 [Capitella teleta]|uniref:Uncharacterized protein n=1 Tax=Capitella teleta TaxID=283909 RepID=R7T406_CAPTE|nr:hypothetical protein CAPTEDRAFT_192824 [Capitella teleta]|eukprot:ELT87538.1 hypothetical protein CAPTEDRAFT_192824 [Capitella teleta]